MLIKAPFLITCEYHLRPFREYFKKKIPSDRTREYWNNAANASLEETMENICENFDKKTFETKKDSMIFELKIPMSQNDVVLDLACGIGRTCRWVAPKVKQYVGVDFIPEMIKKAHNYNKQYENAKFYVNDGITLDMFDNETFDVVYCEIAFQHMLKNVQESYIKEIHRVLKNNGRFYAQIPKMSFYKDDSYALTDTEIKNLLKNFKVTYMDIKNPRYSAYYVFQAEKQHNQ